ncbi:hypothetical protein A45J_0375 [hot springs metagenome]|uniref:Bacteriophage CI repressor N-terminal domain-containing protein n=1 Tax=hot springs metagenome TaxID=433727 RepID=A0A5J4L1M3_9ZZZZ
MKIVKIADRIKKLKGVLSDNDVAELLGMSRTAFAERKRRDSIPYEELVRFAEQESISLDWLLTGKGEPFIKKKEEVMEAEPSMVCEEQSYCNERKTIRLPDDPKLALMMRQMISIYKEGSTMQKALVRGIVEEVYDELREKKQGVDSRQDEGVEPKSNIG